MQLRWCHGRGMNNGWKEDPASALCLALGPLLAGCGGVTGEEWMDGWRDGDGGLCLAFGHLPHAGMLVTGVHDTRARVGARALVSSANGSRRALCP
jgi:hypothetical protein